MASSAATIRSHMQASISPAATHLPCTAAMVGLRKSWMRRQRSTYMTCSWRNLPSGVARIATHSSAASSPTSALRSWPALKCLPAPARTTTRTSSSASARSKARVDAVDERGVLGVGHLGPVHGDGGHRRRRPRSARPAHRLATARLLPHAGRRRPRPPVSPGQARAPARRSRCAGSRWCRRRSTPPDSRARTAATPRRRGCRPRRATAARPGRARRGPARAGACSSRSSTASGCCPRARARGPSRGATASASCGAGRAGPRRRPGPGAGAAGCRRTRRDAAARRSSSSRCCMWMTSWRGFTPRSCDRVEPATRQPSPSAPTQLVVGHEDVVEGAPR